MNDGADGGASGYRGSDDIGLSDAAIVTIAGKVAEHLSNQASPSG